MFGPFDDVGDGYVLFHVLDGAGLGKRTDLRKMVRQTGHTGFYFTDLRRHCLQKVWPQGRVTGKQKC